MTTLTRQYIEDHMLGAHTEESWGRAITEMVLQTAMEELEDQSAEEVVINTQFRIRPVEAVEVKKSDGASFTRSPCLRICLIVTPTGRQICFHRPAYL